MAIRTGTVRRVWFAIRTAMGIFLAIVGRCENPERRNTREFRGICRNITEFRGISRNFVVHVEFLKIYFKIEIDPATTMAAHQCQQYFIYIHLFIF